MKYQLRKDIMTNDKNRAAFDQLAQDTFRLSFEPWYQSGWWSEQYQPYTLFDGARAVANASVNRMDVLWKAQRFAMLQIGTVMTASDYRNQGLSRYLMELIISEWKERVDAIFLFANDSVLDFYPRFGFEKRRQYQCGMSFARRPDGSRAGDIRHLDMDDPADTALLKAYYGKTNPFSRLQAVDYFGLLMFYCIAPLKNHIWYSAANDMVMIAEQERDTLHICDIYCDPGRDWQAMVPDGVSVVTFGYTPAAAGEYHRTEIGPEDDTMFILGGRMRTADLTAGDTWMFPEISHA